MIKKITTLMFLALYMPFYGIFWWLPFKILFGQKCSFLNPLALFWHEANCILFGPRMTVYRNGKKVYDRREGIGYKY